MINYSVHTIELQACISYEEFHELANSLKKLKPSIQANKYQNQMKTPYIKLSNTYRNLPYDGINNITLTIIRTKTYILRCLTYIEINPYNALHKSQQPGPYIIEASQITSAMNLIQKSLCCILNPKIIASLTLNRLDFCANLIFPTQMMAEEYIKLLKCSVPPKALSEFKVFNSRQHRYTAYKESLLLICNSYSFQVYSKYQQMKQKNWKNYDQASGMVRLELRASKTKLKQLVQKYKISSPDVNYMLFLTHAPDIARQEIPDIVSKMAGKENFHGYQYVESKIINSDYKDSDKTLMLNVLRYLSRHSSSQDLLKTFQIPQKDWYKILKKFNRIGTSPISVPRTYQLSTYPGVSNWDAVF